MLKGKNINLRLTKESDLVVMDELYSDILSRGDYYPIDLLPLPEQKKRFAENGFWTEHGGRMVITDKNDAVLGIIGFFKTMHYSNSYELGAILYKPESRGKGIMGEALRIFCAYLFELKNIERLQATCDVDNKASFGVLTKCGFKQEGIMRKAIFNKGRHEDLILLSLMREDCKRLKETIENL